jgi:hypothetical protein
MLPLISMPLMPFHISFCHFRHFAAADAIIFAYFAAGFSFLSLAAALLAA